MSERQQVIVYVPTGAVRHDSLHSTGNTKKYYWTGITLKVMIAFTNNKVAELFESQKEIN